MPQERLPKQALLAEQLKEEKLDDIELDGLNTLRILDGITLVESHAVDVVEKWK